MKKRVILFVGAVLAVVGLSLDNAGKVSVSTEVVADSTHYIEHNENDLFLYGQEQIQEDLNSRLGIE
jgi:hypothetical protein